MKRFAAPLQAFAAFGICLGMSWIVFVVAGFSPSPPSRLDLDARSTQDLSFTSMNSTAVALAKDMLSNMMASPVAGFILPVTGRGTSTPTAMAAVTLKAVSTFSPTPTPKSLFSLLFSSTPDKENGSDSSTSVPASTTTGTSIVNTVPPTFPATQTKAPTSTFVPTKQPTVTKTPAPPNTATPAPTDTVAPPDTATVEPTLPATSYP